jgi:formylglycine-generating enzyme required for sulfatase activity
VDRAGAIDVLGHYGLLLPTEAQWEYAARGGVEAPWWTGPDKTELATAANLSDQSTAHKTVVQNCEAWDDGWLPPAPIARYRPNPFGLHDVIGNVYEWCREDYGSYTLAVEPETGLRLGGDVGFGVIRGGSNFTPAESARAACRLRFPITRTGNDVGVRPVRVIED